MDIVEHSHRLLCPPLTDARPYVHAADLFDCLVAATQADGPALLRTLRLSDRCLELMSGEPEEDACGHFSFTSQEAGSAPVSRWLREDPAGRTTERLALMDSMALEGASIHDDHATVRRDPRFTTMKTALVLGVAMVERLMPDDVLNLADMEARQPLQQGRHIAVRLTRRLAKFLILSVTVDGAPYGRFTLAATPYVEDVPA